MIKVDFDKNNELHFNRSRGIVWVCDIKDSSKFLNEDKIIDDFEIYLQRFYWISRRLVEASKGVYIKWTGDGFLAWYPCPLKRKLSELTDVVLAAAFRLTIDNNVTKLDTDIKENITLRNGITFEEDAIITTIESDDLKATDILGRNVVLAFRLSSFEHFFPSITIQGDLVTEDLVHFHELKKLKINDQDIENYFKGQKHETGNLYYMDYFKKIKEKRKDKSIEKSIKKVIDNIEKPLKDTDISSISQFHWDFCNSLKTGPKWAQNIYTNTINQTIEMYEIIKRSYEIIKNANVSQSSSMDSGKI